MVVRSVLAVLVLIWLVIGILAAYQRGYLSSGPENCSTVGNTILTFVAGPLNYVGVNPQVDCPPVPQPSE